MAADALAKQLEETLAEFPEAEHHLIAHSHGGNVALYALRNPTLCDRTASVVCLATPFIHAGARPIEPAFTVLRIMIYSLALAPGALLVILSLLFALLAAQALPESPFALFLQNTGLPSPHVFAGLIGLSGYLIWGGVRVGRRLTSWLFALLRPRIERYQQRRVNDYNHHAPRPIPVLNAQVERDEPALWLAALHRVSEPTSDSRAAIPMAAMLTLAFCYAIVMDFIHVAGTTASLIDTALYAAIVVSMMYLIWLAMLVLLFGISHLIFITMPLLVRAHGGGFGEWSLFANWLVLIEARTEPPGDFELESIRIAAQGRGLRHSRIYEDEDVIERISNWLAVDRSIR